MQMPGEITALGPSKSAAEAEAHLDAGFLPPLILAAPARDWEGGRVEMGIVGGCAEMA